MGTCVPQCRQSLCSVWKFLATALPSLHSFCQTLGTKFRRLIDSKPLLCCGGREELSKDELHIPVMQKHSIAQGVNCQYKLHQYCTGVLHDYFQTRKTDIGQWSEGLVSCQSMSETCLPRKMAS